MLKSYKLKVTWYLSITTGDESTYGKEYDIFSFEGVDKEYMKPYQARYQKEREFTIDNINCLANIDSLTSNKEFYRNIYITNICQGKLGQLHVVRMLLNNIETNKDIYLLVDRTIISTLVMVTPIRVVLILKIWL